MDRRTRSRRRLLLLLVILIVVVGGLGTFYLARKSRFKARHMAMRRQGLELVEQGRYFQAMHMLGTYINRFGQKDAQAIHQYAYAREHVVEDKGKHLIDAIGMYRRYLGLKPDDTQARRHLLELYRQTGAFGAEMVELADQLLARSPQDPELLRARAYAHGRLGNHDQALADARQALSLKPDLEDLYFLVIELMNRRGDEPRQWMDQAVQWFDTHADQSGFMVVLAYAQLMARQPARAIENCLAAAREARSLSPTVRQHLFQMMTLLHRQQAAALLSGTQLKTTTANLAQLTEWTTRLLEQMASEPDGEPTVTSQWAFRLWELGRTKELATITINEPPVPTASYYDLVALRALAAIQLGQVEQTHAVLKILDQKDNPVAHAWHILLSYRLGGSDSPHQAVAMLEEAANAYPTNACIKMQLAEACAAINEIDRAMKINAQAYLLAPAWPMPLVYQVRLLERAGRPREAARLAMATMQSIPKSYHGLPGMFYAARECATAWASLVSDDQKHPPETLKNLLTEIQRARPFEPQTFVPYVRLLAQSGQRSKAIQLVDDLLARDKVPPLLLADLLEVSMKWKLDRDQTILQRLDGAASPSPELALRRAGRMMAVQGPAPALAAFEKWRAGVERPDSRPWQIAWARLLEQAGDERAAATWASLADAAENRQYLPIQLMVLQSRSAWSDRALIDRAIQRLRQMGGPSNINWRIYRAMWWLQAADEDPQAVQRAAALLGPVLSEAPANSQALWLYSRCLVRQEKYEQAVEPLTMLMKLNPQSADTAIELASCHLALGNAEQAGQFLDALAVRKDLSAEQAKHVAGLLNKAGRLEAACRLLEALDKAGQADEQTLLLWASYLQKAGQVEQAQGVYERLLNRKQPGLASIEYAANFYARQGRLVQAEQILQRLPQSGAEPVEQYLVQANFYANQGRVEQAESCFVKATQTSPASARPWLQYLQFLYRCQQWPKLMSMTAKAAGQCPEDQALKELAQAVELMKRSQPGQEQAQASLRRLDQLIDERPDFYLLQMLAVRHDLQLGRYEHAAEMAGRLMKRFVQASEPAELAVRALAAAGQWSGVLAACEHWRGRLAQPFPADLMSAEACIHLGQFERARRFLQPYLSKVKNQPGPYDAAVVVAARAWLLGGQVDQASALLELRLDQSPRWRQAWAALALLIKDHDKAAGWLKRLEGVIPREAWSEWIMLSEAWWRLAGQSKQPADAQRAYDLLADLSVRYPPAHYHLAVLYDKDERFDLAEKHYRLAIDAQADADVTALACNNLAMLILNRNGDARQALALAEQAVGRHPDSPVFLDTLAQAQARLGDHEASDATWGKAMAAESANPLWPIQMLDAQIDSGRIEQARRTLHLIEQRFAVPGSIGGELRNRLDGLRQSLETAGKVTRNDKKG